MDKALDAIAEFATSLRFEDLPADVAEKATSILVDTLGCALGGRECRAAAIASSYPTLPAPGYEGRVIGHADRPAFDLAAFWNSSMIRYLDINDTLIAGHPSDVIGALAAVSGIRESSGRDILTAIVVSYEVHARIADIMQVWPTIDRTYWSGISAAAAVSNLLGLSLESARHAVSMVATSGVHLRATRAGQLSDYKGVASAMNTRLAVFACYLADKGLTGPSAPFDGRHGLVELLPFAEGELPLAGFDTWMIHRTWQKCFSVAYNMQPSIWAALQLRDLVPPEDVSEITLNVPPLAYAVSGSEADKWDPQTKETADHSLPYAFAHAFRTGALGLDAFEPAAYRDAGTLAFMKHIKVVPDPGFGADVPTVVGVNVEAMDNSGNCHRVSVPHPRGHDANPMTRDEITQKALGLITPVLGDRSEAAVELAWNAAQVDRFGDILDAYENSGSTGDSQ